MKYKNILLAFTLVLISSLLFSNTFPLPGRNISSSLVLLIVEKDESVFSSGNIGNVKIEGIESINVKFGKKMWEVRYFRLPAGNWSAFVSGDSFPFNVAEHSIVLLPQKGVTYGSADGTVYTKIEDIDEEDRQKAAEDLVSYIDFTSWGGRDFLGFGSIKPTLEEGQNKYQLTLRSEPSGAEIYIDDYYKGLTPLSFLIDEDKHQLRFKLNSYLDNSSYISLHRSTEINAEMKESMALGNKLVYRTLVVPFYSVTGKEDQMSDLLADTLIPVLSGDSRMELRSGNIKWKNSGDVLQPDFSSPELSDIDLIASGLYISGEDGLTVLASLYDVRSETVKAGITWKGSIGLNIFDAVDEISLAFLEEVSRVLPAAGKILIKRNSVVYSGLSSLDRRMENKRFIEKRSQNKNSLMFISGIGGIFISMEATAVGAPSVKEINVGDGPPFLPLSIDYERYINNYFSIGGGLEYLSSNLHLDFESSGEQKYNPSILSLNTNARIIVRGLKSDLVIGLGPVIRFMTKNTVVWEDSGIWEDTVEPVFALGVQWSAGFRLYLNKQITKGPSFLYFGFTDTFPQIYFEYGGSRAGLNSSAIGLYLGGGFMF